MTKLTAIFAMQQRPIWKAVARLLPENSLASRDHSITLF